MVFHHVKTSLSQHQLMKLAKGGAIVMKPEHMAGGEHDLWLTSSQHTKMSKGKGMRLHMSQAQIKHHLKHGSGVWSWIKDKVKAGAKAAWAIGRKHLGEAVKAHAPNIADAATSLVGTAANRAFGLNSKVANAIINKTSEGVKKAAQEATTHVGNKIAGGRVDRTARFKLADQPYSKMVKGGKAGGSLFSPGGRGVMKGGGTSTPGSAGRGILPKPIKGVNSNAAGM